MTMQDEDKDDEGGKNGGHGESGKGGAGVRYRDPFAVKQRDDMLPPAEIKRLLLLHKEIHKGRVEKQKIARKERDAVKEKRPGAVAGHGQGYGAGVQSNAARQHPTLSKAAQFSGIDKQVVPLPHDNLAETNQDQKQELEFRHELRHQHQLTQKFNPKPRPF